MRKNIAYYVDSHVYLYIYIYITIIIVIILIFIIIVIFTYETCTLYKMSKYLCVYFWYF